jgi:hypothetical protein
MLEKLIIASITFLSGHCLAADFSPPTVSTSSTLPSYLALWPNINDFNRFANGGSDGNWYIGYNNAWIVELPPAPMGEFPRTFIGAKIGRAKTKPDPDKPWISQRLSGKIYMAISQTPSFGSQQSFMVARAADIPLESGQSEGQNGVGEAEWFWAEVPAALVSFTQPNYLIVWSVTPYFLSASSSPILAAMTAPASMDRPRAWNNQKIAGVPPRAEEGALETPLGNLLPALAIKLCPPDGPPVLIHGFSALSSGDDVVVSFSAEGRDISRAWIEFSADRIDWERSGPFLFHEPLILTVNRAELPGQAAFLRAAASDILGSVGYGPAWPLR